MFKISMNINHGMLLTQHLNTDATTLNYGILEMATVAFKQYVQFLEFPQVRVLLVVRLINILGLLKIRTHSHTKAQYTEIG